MFNFPQKVSPIQNPTQMRKQPFFLEMEDRLSHYGKFVQNKDYHGKFYHVKFLRKISSEPVTDFGF